MGVLGRFRRMGWVRLSYCEEAYEMEGSVGRLLEFW